MGGTVLNFRQVIIFCAQILLVEFEQQIACWHSEYNLVREMQRMRERVAEGTVNK